MPGLMLYSSQMLIYMSVLLLSSAEEQERREREKMEVSLGNAMWDWNHLWVKPGLGRERGRCRGAISNRAGKSRRSWEGKAASLLADVGRPAQCTELVEFLVPRDWR